MKIRTQFYRLCPVCNSIIYYSSKNIRDKVLKTNPSCRSCINRVTSTGRKHTEKTKEKLRNRKYSLESKQKISKALKGIKRSEYTKRKISEKAKTRMSDPLNRKKISDSLIGVNAEKNHPMYGKKHTDETKNKMKNSWKNRPDMSVDIKIKISNTMKKIKGTEEERQKQREIRAKQIIDIGGGPAYNPKACEYFDKLNKEKGWNLQHAMNGGEHCFVGHFIDAYDKDKNIVVEYDEPHHYRKSNVLILKDVERQKRIINHLGCQFYRYNEKNNCLYKLCG